MTFVAQVRQSDFSKSKFPCIGIRQDTPLRQIVQKMMAADIQRIFLLNERGELTRIFSRTDLGRLVAQIIENLLDGNV